MLSAPRSIHAARPACRLVAAEPCRGLPHLLPELPVGLILMVGPLAAGLFAYYRIATDDLAAPGVGHRFTAIRWTPENVFWPTREAVCPRHNVCHKPRRAGKEEESIAVAQVASIKINTSAPWSDGLIESPGGAQPIVCRGHSDGDAKAIKALIRQYHQYGASEPSRTPTPSPPLSFPASAAPLPLRVAAPP